MDRIFVKGKIIPTDVGEWWRMPDEGKEWGEKFLYPVK